MVALNYARDVRIGDKPARAVALGSNFVWPTLPERLFLRGQSMVYDFVGQKYAARLPDSTIDYTTNINDLGILTRASTGTYWGPEGSLLEAAVDEARIQHDPVTGEPLGVLNEGSRTNLLVRSGQAPWGGANVWSTPITANAAVAPDGTETADRIETRAANAARFQFSLDSQPKGTHHVISYYYKREDSQVGAPLSFGQPVNLSLVDEYDEVAANGYTRYVAVFEYAAEAEAILRLYYYGMGVTGSSCLVWGGQLEAGINPTSYIPTIDSPVTRAADNAVIDLSDVFNPDEGTLRITAQVPEGEVVASMGDRHVISDSDEFKEYELNYIFHSGNTVAQLGEGIFNKVEYFPSMQGESDLADLIRTLYGNGEQGAMFIPEPKVLGYQVLYQDAAGTVPVESDGDPVGLMLDLSGNGNHATQSTSAARPVYRTDGVLHWLEFDGVDDFLLIQDLQRIGVSSFYNSVAVSRTGGLGFRAMLSLGGTGPDELLHYFTGTRDRIYVNAGEVDSTSTGGAVYETGERAVSTVFNDGSNWLLWKNLVQNFSELAAVQLSKTDEMWTLGASASGGDRFLQGNIYGQVTRIGESTTDDASQTVTYLATLAGVTL